MVEINFIVYQNNMIGVQPLSFTIII